MADRDRKKKVRRRFSRAAGSYADHALVQRQVAEDLAGGLPATLGRPAILEVGCGPGLLTGLLCRRYPAVPLTAVDFSFAMLATARRRLADVPCLRLLCADGEALPLTGTARFGLVVSSGALQWFRAPAQALADYAGLVAPGGVLAVAVFGPATLAELGRGLTAVLGREVPSVAAGFPAVERLTAALTPRLTDVRWEERTYLRRYPSVRHLLLHLRRTGTGGSGGPVLRLGDVVRLQRWFDRELGAVTVSYQVFFVSGRRRG